MELGERKLKILQAIIKDFITTAEPIGSRTLSKKYDLGISSATIRNEMADLEELGFLAQPHTSAGRIPSDKGYRLYVDHLMDINNLAKNQRETIKRSFMASMGELEQAIVQSSKILSQMTKLTSIVLSPQFRESKLKHIQLLPIDDENILLVIVSESSTIKNAILRVKEPYTEDSLQMISKVLNVKLKGRTIDEISNMNMIDIQNEINKFNSVFQLVMPTLISTLEDMVNVQLYLDGLTNIFSLPEYSNISKAREFMAMMDHKENITDILMNRKNEVDITIGKENKNEEMKECSLITATYHLNGRLVGKIGVIGPTRMDYENIISIVDFMRKNLTNILKGSVIEE